MKYYININQLVLSRTNLDIKDAAILDYLKAFCASDDKSVKQLKIEENGITYSYTWINFNYLIKQMPLLKINQKASISERLVKISKAGYIKTFKAPDNSLYVRLTENIKKLDFYREKESVSLNKQGVSENNTEVLAKTNSTISILNNNISNKEKYNNLEQRIHDDFDLAEKAEQYKKDKPLSEATKKKNREILERIRGKRLEVVK